MAVNAWPRESVDLRALYARDRERIERDMCNDRPQIQIVQLPGESYATAEGRTMKIMSEWRARQHPAHTQRYRGTPISRIHMVNVAVLDPNGHWHQRTSVELIQPNEPKPDGRSFCYWMPYQQGQAAKTEALESKLRDGV